MTIRLEPKRPDEVRRLRHDWSAFLGTDTLATQTTTSTDVTITNAAIDTAGTPPSVAIDFTVSGGVDGALATITQHVTTAAGDQETEIFVIPIRNADEPVGLSDAKSYLRVFSSAEDAKIAAMIPRARAWVEDYTGLSLIPRQFTERLLPTRSGLIHLSKGPLISVDSVDYVDGSGLTQTFTPLAYPPSNMLMGTWPSLTNNERFSVTYTAGFTPAELDDRLIGAVLALVEGEFSSGAAYPQTATDAAERCCGYLRAAVA